MRRFSDKHPLHTLSEINITPLLDLAFVLLIIFIITTPLMDKTVGIILPTSKSAADAVNPSAVQTVSLNKDDEVALNSEPVPLDQLSSRLSTLHTARPEIAVVVRSHRELPVQKVMDVLDAVRRSGVTKVGLVTTPEGK